VGDIEGEMKKQNSLSHGDQRGTEKERHKKGKMGGLKNTSKSTGGGWGTQRGGGRDVTLHCREGGPPMLEGK